MGSKVLTLLSDILDSTCCSAPYYVLLTIMHRLCEILTLKITQTYFQASRLLPFLSARPLFYHSCVHRKCYNDEANTLSSGWILIEKSPCKARKAKKEDISAPLIHVIIAVTQVRFSLHDVNPALCKLKFEICNIFTFNTHLSIPKDRK